MPRFTPFALAALLALLALGGCSLDTDELLTLYDQDAAASDLGGRDGGAPDGSMQGDADVPDDSNVPDDAQPDMRPYDGGGGDACVEGPEVCDGVDNDCDSRVDENGPGLCTAGELCYQAICRSGGSVLWAFGFGGDGGDAAHDVAPLGTGVMVGAHLRSSTALSLGAETVGPTVAEDYLVFDVAPDGTPTLQVTGGDAGQDFAYGVGSFGPERYVTGTIRGVNDFLGTGIGSDGSTDLFYASWSGSSALDSFSVNSLVSGIAAETEGNDLAALTMGDVAVVGTGRGNISGCGNIASNRPNAIFRRSASGGCIRLQGGDSEGRAVVADPVGDAFWFAGVFSGTSTPTGGSSLGTAGRNDVFLVRVDGASRMVTGAWSFGGSGDDEVYGMAIEGSTLVLVGSTDTNPLLTLGGQPIDRTGRADADMMIWAVDTADPGTALWAAVEGGTGDDVAHAVSIDGDRVHVTGTTQSGGEFAGTMHAGTRDLVVAAYDARSDGAGLWSQVFGDTGLDVGYGVTRNDGLLYVVGSYAGVVDVGADILMATPGNVDSFVLGMVP